MSVVGLLAKRWVVNEVDEPVVRQLQAELKIHPVLCQLLVQRGITTFDEARNFFRPEMEHLHDPFLMMDMEKAVGRLQQAIASEERILVYGDYDVDGTTAVALVYSFLKDFYHNIDYYIPDRFEEGYGISFQGIDYASEQNISLIIALDCGIRSIDKVAYAHERSIDFIICDHHLPGDDIPDAWAILDPKQMGCNYPFKELSGCGIGFKLVQAFAQRNNLPDVKVHQMLDLVAVSIASDIVPIVGENRVLAYYGLQMLNNTPRLGLVSLIAQTGLDGKELTIMDLVFYLGPRINAAGRMEHGKNAVAMLLADTDEEAFDTATNLHDNNADRKQLDKDITDEALAMIDADPTALVRKTNVLFQPHWSKGVIGIVASRLIETYYKPTIVLTESNGFVTGSARSVAGFDVHEAISACADLLEQFGGHKYAAGLTLKRENLDAFIERFELAVSATITAEQLTPEIMVDAELDLIDITPRFYKILQQFAPFGPGNMRPVFMAKSCKDKGNSKIVGEKHLKLNVTQDGKHSFAAIAFGMGNLVTDVVAINGRTPIFDLLYNIDENEWQGNVSLQLNVKDIKPH